jgi:hypothetical protein
MMVLGMPLLQFVMLVQVTNILVSLALGVAGFFFRNTFTGKAAFEAACARISELETSNKVGAGNMPSREQVADLKLGLLAVEAGERLFDEKMKALATKDDIANVRDTLSRQDGNRRDLAGEVQGIKATVNAIQRTLDLVSQSLMEDRKKS